MLLGVKCNFHFCTLLSRGTSPFIFCHLKHTVFIITQSSRFLNFHNQIFALMDLKRKRGLFIFIVNFHCTVSKMYCEPYWPSILRLFHRSSSPTLLNFPQSPQANGRMILCLWQNVFIPNPYSFIIRKYCTIQSCIVLILEVSVNNQ